MIPDGSQESAAGPSDEPGSRDDAFVRLFVQHQRILFEYLVTALGSAANAEDVLQEVSVILWRERASFEMGTNFVGWAIAIARNQVRKFRRSCTRDMQLPAGDVLEDLAAEAVSEGGLAESRRQALQNCLELLRDRERSFLMTAYSTIGTKKALAEELGMPLNTIYTTLNRLRRRLHDCIERRLAAEGRQ